MGGDGEGPRGMMADLHEEVEGSDKVMKQVEFDVSGVVRHQRLVHCRVGAVA